MSIHKLALTPLLLLLSLLLQGELGLLTFPPDYDYGVENENKLDEEGKKGTWPETPEHTYYNMTVLHPDEQAFARAYVDVPLWIKEGGAEGQTEHSHLDDAYRKAAGVRLKFDFPFYGHLLRNLTIATGGFLYVGDQTHSWLAATQYIAPLMANFDTMQSKSSIQFGEDEKRMIVEWRDVTLRDNRQAGNFTFQVQLWRNGNITFVYKEVPIPIANISDAQHPCKLGISDAYLFNQMVKNSLFPSLPHQVRRVIHQYHRISIPGEQIASKTVVHLRALPTCSEATSCEECTKMQLKQFKCTWCNPKENGKGKEAGTDITRPFCTDQLGLHRLRQEWIEGHCQVQEEKHYCKADKEQLPLRPDGSNSNATVLPDSA